MKQSETNRQVSEWAWELNAGVLEHIEVQDTHILYTDSKGTRLHICSGAEACGEDVGN